MDGDQQQQQRRRYQVGGSVPRDRDYVYVERRADAELLALCRNGEYGYVLGSRQIGKSSLMTRAAALLHPEGIVTVHVILAKLIASGPRQGAEWMDGVVTELASELGLQGALARWNTAGGTRTGGTSPREVAAIDRFVGFFRDVALPALEGKPLVVFFDEVDSVLRIPSTDAFFRAVRILHERRTHRTEGALFRRLSIVLAGVVAPDELVSDKRRMPFNIGKPVGITPFGRTEVGKLIDWWAPAPVQAELAEEILHWTGGYAGLTVALCDLIYRRPAKRWNRLGVRALVQSELDAGGSIFAQPVRIVFNQIVASPRCVSLLSIYRKVLEGKTVQDDARSLDVSLLKVYGLCRADGGRLLVSNEITHTVLEPDAVEQAIRDARPWQRWIEKASDPKLVAWWGAGLVLLVMALIAITFGLTFYLVRKEAETEAALAIADAKASAARADKDAAVAKAAEAKAAKDAAVAKAAEAKSAKDAAEAKAAKDAAVAKAAKADAAAARAKAARNAADAARANADVVAAKANAAKADADAARAAADQRAAEAGAAESTAQNALQTAKSEYQTKLANRGQLFAEQQRDELLAGSWTVLAELVSVAQSERRNDERSAPVATSARKILCTYWSLFRAAPPHDVAAELTPEIREQVRDTAYAECWRDIDTTWLSTSNGNDETFATYLDDTATSEAVAALAYSLGFSFPLHDEQVARPTDVYLSPTADVAVSQFPTRLEIHRAADDCEYISLAIRNEERFTRAADVVFTQRMHDDSTGITPHEGLFVLERGLLGGEHQVSFFDYDDRSFRPLEGSYERIAAFGSDYREAIVLAGRSGTWILDWDDVSPSPWTPPLPTRIGEGSTDPVEVLTVGTIAVDGTASVLPAVAVGRQIAPWRAENDYGIEVLWASLDEALLDSDREICEVRGEGMLRALSFSSGAKGHGASYLVAATSRGIQMWELWPENEKQGACRKIFVDPHAATADEDKKLRSSARLESVVYSERGGTLAGTTRDKLKVWKIEDLTSEDPTRRERPLKLPFAMFELEGLAYDRGAGTFYIRSNSQRNIRRHYVATVTGVAHAALRAQPQCRLEKTLREQPRDQAPPDGPFDATDPALTIPGPVHP